MLENINKMRLIFFTQPNKIESLFRQIDPNFDYKTMFSNDIISFGTNNLNFYFYDENTKMFELSHLDNEKLKTSSLIFIHDNASLAGMELSSDTKFFHHNATNRAIVEDFRRLNKSYNGTINIIGDKGSHDINCDYYGKIFKYLYTEFVKNN